MKKSKILYHIWDLELTLCFVSLLSLEFYKDIDSPWIYLAITLLFVDTVVRAVRYKKNNYLTLKQIRNDIDKMEMAIVLIYLLSFTLSSFHASYVFICIVLLALADLLRRLIKFVLYQKTK